MYLISQYELSSNTKLQAVTATTEKDIQLFQQHIRDLESTLEKQRVQLQFLQQNLKNEQTHLLQRKEYDALSGVILGYEDREILTERSNQLRMELDQLERQNNELIQLIELRHKQFALLMHTVSELESTLEEESAQKEQDDQPYLAEKQHLVTPSTPQLQSTSNTSDQPESAVSATEISMLM